MLNVKRYDYGSYTKNYLNTKTGKSISLQSSPIHQTLQPNQTCYSRSTNSTPQHFYNHLNHEKNSYNYLDSNGETNLEDYLEYERGSSLEDLNCELNNQNSSNDEYDNSEESNEHCTKAIYNKRFELNNKINSDLYNQTYIKHSRSYQNDFFDSESSKKINLLNKPTSLSLSGNNLNNLNNNNSNLCKLDKLNSNELSPKNKKFEMFIMTGDHILNLSRSNSEENPMISAGIANFKKTDTKGVLNKQKIRKIKEGKRKTNSKVNNSDQMRECLSPEIKLNKITGNILIDLDACVDNLDEFVDNKIDDVIDQIEMNNQLELVNNSINDSLTNNFKDDIEFDKASSEDHIVVTTFEGQSSVELTNAKNESINNEIDNDKKNDKNDKSEETGIQNAEISSLSQPRQNNENSTSIKRYPTFIQQQTELDSYLINDQPNLHQKAIDEASAHRLARRLFNLDKFKKVDIARHLSKNNEYCSIVAQEYCNFFDFTDLSLIDALRKFLGRICLIGENQERERVLHHFSRRYFNCNSSTFTSAESVYRLTCAIMILNGDLHGEVSEKK